MLVIGDRRSHIDHDIFPISSQYDLTFCGLDMDFRLVRESLLIDILEKASSSISAHLDLGSILVVDAIFVILYRRWLYDKYLVTSDSEVSITELLGKCWSDVDLRM